MDDETRLGLHFRSVCLVRLSSKILEMFIFISLFFTLLTIPFIELLRRDLKKQGIKIILSKTDN